MRTARDTRLHGGPGPFPAHHSCPQRMHARVREPLCTRLQPLLWVNPSMIECMRREVSESTASSCCTWSSASSRGECHAAAKHKPYMRAAHRHAAHRNTSCLTVIITNWGVSLGSSSPGGSVEAQWHKGGSQLLSSQSYQLGRSARGGAAAAGGLRASHARPLSGLDVRLASAWRVRARGVRRKPPTRLDEANGPPLQMPLPTHRIRSPRPAAAALQAPRRSASYVCVVPAAAAASRGQHTRPIERSLAGAARACQLAAHPASPTAPEAPHVCKARSRGVQREQRPPPRRSPPVGWPAAGPAGAPICARRAPRVGGE